METAKNVLYSFMLVSLSAGGLSLFAEHSGHLGKYIRYAISLALIFTLMLPLRELLYLLPRLATAEIPTVASVIPAEKEASSLQNRIADISEELIREGIRRDLIARGAMTEEVSITVDRSDLLAMELTEIRVVFSAGTDHITALRMMEILSERYLCRCEYGIKEDGGDGG